MQLWPLLLTLVSVSPSSGHQRGPHHPRGGKSFTHQHYRPHKTDGEEAPKLTQDTDLLRDTDHIREDMGEWVTKEDTQKMTPEELEFHYFKLHDFDNNTKLDGLEILQAIHHTVHSESEEGAGDGEEKSADHQQRQDDFQYFVDLIDQVLAEDDLDNDGYLSYVEYVVGRKKNEHKNHGKYNRPHPQS
uniref:Multiple coagulation factor deficiency protein 2 n=1 Tax=Timema poppense TaxID=170557 RepID=A0A7R9HG69_TIMPO|nr:unnamed protein product [Timema poppensis]